MQKLKYERPFIKKMQAGIMNKFGHNTGPEVVSYIDQVPVKSLIEKFGSPLFVLSEQRIRRNYNAAVRAFSTRYPKVQFAWSYKTNYLNAVCNIFHQEGSWAEVVSGFEYYKSVNNGVPANHIIFNGPYKEEAALVQAIENNALIHIDHFDELYKLITLAVSTGKRPRVAVRVSMDTGTYPVWDRFGFNYEDGQAWSAITKVIESGVMQLEGLHCHIGTFVLSTSAYGIAASKMCALAMRCKKELNHVVQYLDLGGGFPSVNTLKGYYGVDPIPSMDAYAEVITGTILNYGFEKDELPLLILETGRALIDDAGFLLGTVVAGKRLSDGRKATIVDFGVNILFTSFWYDHKISAAQATTQQTEETVLYGPLCMNIDVLRESVNLPMLNAGDHIVVHKVGAYNMTQWMQFINTRPAVVLIDKSNNVHMIRKPETLEYMQQPELLPDHLKIK